jgi:hypothetical protein
MPNFSDMHSVVSEKKHAEKRTEGQIWHVNYVVFARSAGNAGLMKHDIVR